MFVAATTQCYPELSFDDCVEKLSDLEFSHIEIGIHEDSNHIKPSEVREHFAKTYDKVHSTRRLVVTGFSLGITDPGEQYFETFTSCCELAKASKIVQLTVPASVYGTAFNEEVERYKRLVKIAEAHGVRVAMRSAVDTLGADIDTVSVICGHVKGLGLSIDPSHLHYEKETAPDHERLIQYVHNVYLRDSTPSDLQVRVGQGIIDFGKLINQLRKVKYNRALCVDIAPQDDVDHDGEMRKMRLLLESLVML